MKDMTLRRLLCGAVWLALAVWTGYWIVNGRAYLYEHSIVMQQGFGGDGVQLWEIFNVKMVAAHHAIRWGAGVVVAALMLGLLRRRTQEASAVSGDDRPLATAG
jgi:hypothetical protein